MPVPEPDPDALAAFWTDARIRAKFNRPEAYFGPTATESVPPPTFAFGADPATADRLLDLVLAKTKTATASALRDYEADDEALPKRGLLSIVLDGRGHPRALICTTEVEVVRFGDVDDDHAAAEGEGTLQQWRGVHRDFFGPDVDDDTQVVLERFRLLYP